MLYKYNIFFIIFIYEKVARSINSISSHNFCNIDDSINEKQEGRE
jgi:hypothetical protein